MENKPKSTVGFIRNIVRKVLYVTFFIYVFFAIRYVYSTNPLNETYLYRSFMVVTSFYLTEMWLSTIIKHKKI